MADFLKFINELTVNGKPVDEDEDDDYTATQDGEEENDNSNLDLNPTSADENPNQPNEDDIGDDDDYTSMAANVDDTGPESAEGDDQNNGDEDNSNLDLDPTSNDNTADQDTDNNNPDDTTDDTGSDADNNLDMGTDDNTEDDDYTAGGDTDTDDSSETDITADNDTSSSDTNDSELDSKIKQTESEIFNALSDDEKAIKNRQLIDNYIDLKKISKVFLEKVQTITVTDLNSQILTFVELNLLDINNMITDYIITRYNRKSYIENFVTYQQFILTIEQLKEIISKININDENSQK